MSKQVKTWVTLLAAPLVAVALLAGLVAEAATRVQPTDAEPFHQRARLAVEGIPKDIGPWRGTDWPVPLPALQLLHPNVIISRTFERHSSDAEGAQWANLLLVQCHNAGDLQGHYPPNCYKASGDTLLSKKPRTWHIGRFAIPGMEYEFAHPTGAGLSDRRIVCNFFVIPHVPGVHSRHPDLDRGAVCPDMDSVYLSAEDYQRRYYGAAEFQVLTSASLSEQQRDQIFTELIGPQENVIRVLLNQDDFGGGDVRSGGQSP